MKTPVPFLLFLGAVQASALDLTPRFVTTLSDGVSIRRPFFADGARKYALTLNMETALEPYEDGALFRFVTLREAAMRLRPSPFRVDTRFGPESLNLYRETARKLLPPTSTQVELEAVVDNPMPINGWESLRFVFKHRTHTGEWGESITFLNITPEKQVIVQVHAPAPDFVQASERAWDILRRWHELDSLKPHGGS
jgi:hypothetical protein